MYWLNTHTFHMIIWNIFYDYMIKEFIFNLYLVIDFFNMCLWFYIERLLFNWFNNHCLLYIWKVLKKENSHKNSCLLLNKIRYYVFVNITQANMKMIIFYGMKTYSIYALHRYNGTNSSIHACKNMYYYRTCTYWSWYKYLLSKQTPKYQY